jgi:predicted CoA-substrate-specific enzyme activase
MKTVGICIGAVSIQQVLLHSDERGVRVVQTQRVLHEGDTLGAFKRVMQGPLVAQAQRVAATGRAFRTQCGLSAISEVNAVEWALRFCYANAPVPQNIISFGGETLLLYRIGARGAIEGVHSAGKCASGKGSFFLQQLKRMNLSADEAVEQALHAAPYPLASRCSVFCKSDCTHALNKGESVGTVVAGLCSMMADSAAELLQGRMDESVALIGGCSLNGALCSFLRDRCKGLHVPLHADCFEALGAALWAVENECSSEVHSVASHGASAALLSQAALVPLAEAAQTVRYCPSHREAVCAGEEYVVGLDAGSTTTKAVLVSRRSSAIVASVYLRTNGNPVEAARHCYARLAEQVGQTPISIIGLGTTGSGRHLTGLHADTEMVIDEILAHATAAVHFDESVDTIFEIGGQDAKYTHLTAAVPSEYAMNEACSAGTGSFLEEAAAESLDVGVEDIAQRALAAQRPEDFSDQCAAFIGSDIKRAVQEGVSKDNILAGLVYSVCLNYLNKVKGSRRTGQRIFMQGGVCYNAAVPAAMAALTHATITVPPDPGLMGALGVALELLHRLEAGVLQPHSIMLRELQQRSAVREGTFVCNGGKEQCDRKCVIARIRVGETVKPFGGICNRFYNQRVHVSIGTAAFDYAAKRAHLLFDHYGRLQPLGGGGAQKVVGLNRSFLMHQLLPLFSTFFTELGFTCILSDATASEGRSRVQSEFCYPGEISHGGFLNLLKQRPDYLFLPLVKHAPVPDAPVQGETCVLVQGEPYYLQTTFRVEIEQSGCTVLNPVLWMQQGYEQGEGAFVELGGQLGVSARSARAAFQSALQRQRAYEKELLQQGSEALDYVHADASRIGIVIFGRPYNAFAPEADRGIAHKIASRGITVIPADMVDAHDMPASETMFWGMGQRILKGAQRVKADPQLFAVYISNFSCGPDSFVLGFFRDIMEQKPWLTLELDGHTADAGIDTRIDAALSIIERYRTLPPGLLQQETEFIATRVVHDKQGVRVIDSSGTSHNLTDDTVELLLPSMGRRGTEAAAAACRRAGLHARALPMPDRAVLNAGRRHSTCKECMPYHLTSGSFITYLENQRAPGRVSLLFLPDAAGPCRLGQYGPAMKAIINQQRYRDTAVLSLTDEDGYLGLGSKVLVTVWEGLVLSDVFGDIEGMLQICAQDVPSAMVVFEQVWQEVVAALEGVGSTRLATVLQQGAARLGALPLCRDPHTVPVVSLVGEIFVRREEFSRKTVVTRLQQSGFFVKVAPIHEYFHYADHVMLHQLNEKSYSSLQRLQRRFTSLIQSRIERRIKRVLARSGLYHFDMVPVQQTIDHGKHLLPEQFRGEHLLTVGLALREMLTSSCGVVSIGPFGCMPSRVAESVLTSECSVAGLARIPKGCHGKLLQGHDANESLPFLAIEADGGPFPQVVEARLEAFVLQARRTFERMQAQNSSVIDK